MSSALPPAAGALGWDMATAFARGACAGVLLLVAAGIVLVAVEKWRHR